jgi:hypothetical protein
VFRIEKYNTSYFSRIKKIDRFDRFSRIPKLNISQFRAYFILLMKILPLSKFGFGDFELLHMINICSMCHKMLIEFSEIHPNSKNS